MGKYAQTGYIPIKYPASVMLSDNQWLHKIANETAESNFLLKTLIDLYIEDNPSESRKPETAHEKSGAL